MNHAKKFHPLRPLARTLRDLSRDERGMSTVEYVILLAVICVGAIATWNSIGGTVKAELDSADQELMTIGDTE